MAADTTRYTAFAIVLHWAIACAILFMLPLGFWMHGRAEANDVSEGVFRAFQLHKSIGLTVLALSLVRLIWRLLNPPPPLPAPMPGWEKFAALATHWLFYVIMIGLPLSGWLYVSSGWSIHTDQPLAVPTRYFGLIQVPALFGLPHASNAARASTAHGAFTAHFVLAYAAIGLAILHVAAALKHQLVDRDEVLAHMVPGLPAAKLPPRARNSGRLAVLGAGLGVTTLLTVLALYTVFTLPLSTQPPTAAAQTPSTFETATTAPAATTPTTPTTTATSPPSSTAQTAGMARWRVNQAASSVGFRFVYQDPENGNATFNGRFARWRADIRFDPDDLAHSRADVTIDVGSAADGVDIHDRSLPTGEWFDAAGHPTAEFHATSMRRSGSGYAAPGQLTIKGHAHAITLPFTLTIDGDHARMSGHVAIQRGDYDLGVRSDANDMISQSVTIDVRVDATRTP